MPKHHTPAGYVAYHGRDIVNWRVNVEIGWNLGVAPVSIIAPVS
ncbi:MAG: hypothetical protein NWF00_00195 [Candidatus Bathyarchaeota archaeon]|nr:hypothetical protein [Candidatus Bathyarchaeota archaeon]